MTEGISESRFNMWRAVFAVAHADDFLALEEQGLLYDYIEQNPFSDDQRNILREDVATPQNVEKMFSLITEQDDRIEFFELARALIWCDGDFDKQEQEIISRLQNISGIETMKDELERSRKHSVLEKLHTILSTDGLNGLISKIT